MLRLLLDFSTPTICSAVFFSCRDSKGRAFFFLAGIRSVTPFFCWNGSILLQAFLLQLFMEQAQKIVLESPEIAGRHDRPEEVEPGPAGSIVFQPEGLERPRKLRLVPGRHEPPRPQGPAVEGVPGRHAQPVQRLHSEIRNSLAR